MCMAGETATVKAAALVDRSGRWPAGAIAWRMVMAGQRGWWEKRSVSRWIPMAVSWVARWGCWACQMADGWASYLA